MRALWFFLHVFGFILWIGGALAVMAMGVGGKRERLEDQGLVVRLQALVYRMLIGPGALVTVVSGFVLTLQMYGQATAVGLSHGLMAMQGLGLIAAIVVFVVALPTSAKLARLEPIGADAAPFHGLRRRLISAGMGSGVLALLALVTGVLYRYRG